MNSSPKTVPDVTLEGMPHNITDTAPGRCAKELLRFLNAHRSA